MKRTITNRYSQVVAVRSQMDSQDAALLLVL